MYIILCKKEKKNFLQLHFIIIILNNMPTFILESET